MALSRSPSPNTLERRLSIEETYSLAETARRKSSSESARHDLRLKVGHAHMLEALENAIRSSPPPSPRQPSSQLHTSPSSKHISWSALEVTQRYTPSVRSTEEVDEYGFSYDDEGEDYDGLSLIRTSSRRF